MITGGYPIPPGRTLLEKRAWLWRHDDGLWRMLNFEPRGHGMMCSVLLMPPIAEGADFSVIIIEQDEYVPMRGHCIIGTAMTVVATGMVPAHEPFTTVRIETPAGLVCCEVDVADGRVGPVSFTNVDSFLLHRDAQITVEGLGALTFDVAYGGDFYVMVDADPLGLPLAPDNDASLIATAKRIIPAANAPLDIRHPKRPDIDRCYESLLHLGADHSGPPQQTMSARRSLDRSALRDGYLGQDRGSILQRRDRLDEPLRFEGVLGTVSRAPQSRPRSGAASLRAPQGHRPRLAHRLPPVRARPRRPSSRGLPHRFSPAPCPGPGGLELSWTCPDRVSTIIDLL